MREGSCPLEIVVSPPMAVAQSLALDEESTRVAGSEGRWTLRLWWGAAATVVIGRSEKPELVANLEACRRRGIPVLARISGGGTVLQTPDVFNYSLTGPAPAVFDIRAIFREGARLLVGALARLGLEAAARGISDVAIGDRKISGNAMARRWGGLLLHGTLLLDMDLDLLEECLLYPPREPDYRLRRRHRDFLTTLRAQGLSPTAVEVEGAVVASARQMVAEGLLPLSFALPRG